MGGLDRAGLNLGMQLPQSSRVRQLNHINSAGATRVSAFIRFAFNSMVENTDTRIMSVAGVRRVKRPNTPPLKKKKKFTTGATVVEGSKGRTRRPLAAAERATMGRGSCRWRCKCQAFRWDRERVPPRSARLFDLSATSAPAIKSQLHYCQTRLFFPFSLFISDTLRLPPPNDV